MKYIDWFDSYLKKRNIVVNLEKTLSETRIANCGVPQGLILGPILFLSYVNDMKTALKNCNLRFYSHQNVKFIKRNIDYDFNNFCEWFIDMKLLILERIKLKVFYSKEGIILISHYT